MSQYLLNHHRALELLIAAFVVFGIAALIFSSSASVAGAQSSSVAITNDSPAASSKESRFDRSDFNPDVRPQDDLFEHVNGRWLRETEIPADKSNYGSFTALADLSQRRCNELIKQLAEQDHAEGTDAQKIGDFYKSFMDVDRVNQRGGQPLAEQLNQIDAIEDVPGLVKHMAHLMTIGVDSPLGLYVSQDAKNSDVYAVHLIQNGITLPDRDYYLNHDRKTLENQLKFLDYIETVFSLAKIESADDAAGNILSLESELAEASWPRVRIRNAKERYNKYTIEELSVLTSHIDYAAVFEAINVKIPPYVIVNTPSFFETLDRMLVQRPIEDWKLYLKLRLINSFEQYLSQAFVDANFQLFKKSFAGVEQQKPRWERGVRLVAGRGGFGALGDAVGKLYVQQHFKPDAKEKMDVLVQNLMRAFNDSIDELTWMSDATKTKAREKLKKIRTKIGYTTSWRDYSGLKVATNDLFGNVVRSNKVEFRRMVDKLGQPIDREQWGMTPQTVNAYYSATKNEIVFPAAILQSPFFDADAATPLNYGGIGAVIGHEISHAFDDQGSQYDGDGNLNNWWTQEDREAFEALTSQLVDQYDQYQPLPGKTVNGQFTLGENIADLSGLAIAYKAMAYENLPPKKIAEWTPEQLFFVGWSRVWQRKYREAEMLKRLLTDPHSPSQYRANGPVMNIDAFYDAFDVKPGDRLYKPQDQRIKIW
jgi:predicted metalloendopeptidase